MSATYKIDFEKLRQEGLKELFASLERAFVALDIDFYVVGATARDTWFALNDIKALGTTDVDFAVFIPEREDFEELKKYLVEKEEFSISSQNQFVVFSPQGLEVDLLPFGDIEIEGKVMMQGKGLTKISVNGFREVYEEAIVPVKYDDELTFKVCTLPGIVILKLIAFDDRPEMRSKDILDIAVILQHYFDIESDLIYEHHLDLFEEDADLKLIAGRVLGRQMRQILQRSIELEKRVIGILQAAIEGKESSTVVKLLAGQNKMDVEFATQLIVSILSGAKENNKN